MLVAGNINGDRRTDFEILVIDTDSLSSNDFLL